MSQSVPDFAELTLPACEQCSAEEGQPCDPDCPGGPPSMESEEGRLMAAIWRLPFAALIPDPPDRHSLAPDEWITELADWMETYSVVLGSEVHRLQEDSTRAMTLQLERDVVRNFFGLTKEESPVD